MLLEYGTLTVSRDWRILERAPVNYSRIYYVYSGYVEYEDQNTTEVLEHGCLYIFPSSLPYKMKQNPDNPLCCLYLHMELIPALVSKLIKIDIKENIMLKHFLDAMDCAIIERQVKTITSMADVLCTYCKENNIITYPEHSIANAITYISQNLNKDINLDKLSKIVGYNKEYFIRLFKRCTGITPYQYIISCRLHEAIKLLKNGFSITQVAQETGYKEPKALARAFKSHLGITPGEWRKKYQVIP